MKKQSNKTYFIVIGIIIVIAIAITIILLTKKKKSENLSLRDSDSSEKRTVCAFKGGLTTYMGGDIDSSGNVKEIGNIFSRKDGKLQYIDSDGYVKGLKMSFNLGKHYDQSTGTFTAPSNGNYVFTINAS